MHDLKSYSIEELTQFLKSHRYKETTARQIFKSLYKSFVKDVSFLDIPSEKLICILKREHFIENIIQKRIILSLDGTKKYLWELSDGEFIEGVLIKYDRRNIICVSSQVGCNMGCKFCATAKMRYRRNLTTGEMLDQIIHIIEDNNLVKYNVVFMGMGEPLNNFNNLRKAVNILTSHYGFMLGERKITISTCGIVDKIKRLADESWKCLLAISLNAIDDHRRSKIMPVNKKYNLKTLLSSIKYYQRITGKIITFEYVLFDGFNDSDADLEGIYQISQEIDCKINLIPYNDVPETDYRTVKNSKIEKIWEKLYEKGVEVYIRMKKGNDINAACGQLKTTYERELEHYERPFNQSYNER